MTHAEKSRIVQKYKIKLDECDCDSSAYHSVLGPFLHDLGSSRKRA
jgi:hypothetical protein